MFGCCFVVSVVALLVLFVYAVYEEYYPMIHKDRLEDEEAFHRFHGDPEKMRYYRAFKKYFRGDLTEEGLKNWLLHHPRH